MRYIRLNDLENLITRYSEAGGFVYTIEGSLLDNHILMGKGLKTFIVREQYLNEWSSANQIITYQKLPKKYAKVCDYLDNGETEKAEKLFFS